MAVSARVCGTVPFPAVPRPFQKSVAAGRAALHWERRKDQGEEAGRAACTERTMRTIATVPQTQATVNSCTEPAVAQHHHLRLAKLTRRAPTPTRMIISGPAHPPTRSSQMRKHVHEHPQQRRSRHNTSRPACPIGGDCL